MHGQKGFTFWSLVFTIGPIVIVALLVMLLFPAYTEYFTIKKAINRIGGDASLNAMSDADIRGLMDKTMQVDQIHSIKSSDLVIAHGTTGTTVAVDYEVVVPIVANVSALLSFSVSTGKAGDAAGAAN